MNSIYINVYYYLRKTVRLCLGFQSIRASENNQICFEPLHTVFALRIVGFLLFAVIFAFLHSDEDWSKCGLNEWSMGRKE